MNYVVNVKPGGQLGFVATLRLPGQPADRIVEEVTAGRAVESLLARVKRHPVSFQRQAIHAIESAAAIVTTGKDGEIGATA